MARCGSNKSKSTTQTLKTKRQKTKEENKVEKKNKTSVLWYVRTYTREIERESVQASHKI